MVLGVTAVIAAQTPRTHRLEATPSTVAYGYYWSESKPVLRIASGDILDVDTLLTSTPDRLEKAGIPAAQVQPALRAIVEQVKDRGPGGHILTGPVHVEGAEPGDALEVRVLSTCRSSTATTDAAASFGRTATRAPVSASSAWIASG